jgi:ABC-type lipoprotein release transport system permease subunit
MQLILKIAWRNILRHKGKSIIIGTILFIGSLLMTVGNGVISGMDIGLENNIVNGFTGDILIISDKEKDDSVLIKMMGQSVESFSNYKDIKKLIGSEKYIKDMMPVGKNVTTVLNDEDGDPGFSMVLGVDYDRYKKFFPDNFYCIEGKPLQSNVPGVMVPSKGRDELFDNMNIWFLPTGGKVIEKNLSKNALASKNNLSVRDSIVYLGMTDGNSSSDVRLPVNGIIKYRALNTIWGHFSIMDIDSYRECLGYFSASDMSADISKEKKKLLTLDETNLDSMFGSDNVIVSDKGSKDISGISFKRSDKKKRSASDKDAGTFNFVFIKLKNSNTLDASLASINAKLKTANLGVRATSWKKASGVIGSLAVIIKSILFTFVTFLFFVAIIIIVNTLSMAAMERTTEIGMMRAVGAYKSFISGMFIGETTILSGFFGGLGILIGIIVIKIIPLLKISSDNDLIQLIYGGDTFMPHLSMGDISITVLQLLLVTLITIIYPVKIARSITPLDAISRD